MRKALIAIAVATALFAVGAFAASFAVNSEDIASGTDTVDNCADLVDVDFTTSYDNVAGAGDWNVTAAKLTFYDETAPGSGIFATTPDCQGFGAAVVVQTATNTNAANGEVTSISGSTATVSLAPTLKASAVKSASVLVDGENLQLATGGGGLP